MICRPSQSKSTTSTSRGSGRRFPKRLALVLLFVSLAFNGLYAQKQPVDSLSERSRKGANTAALCSAILPGAGQIYNHKYWKFPIVVGGFAALYYVSAFNNQNYQDFRQAYINRIDGDSLSTDPYPTYTVDDIRVRKDYYRRNRDFCYILMGGLYILNIVDAYVDAQLKDFDVSDDLSIRVSPDVQLLPTTQWYGGMSLTLTLR